jgi:histidinol phosphatase-like enzyme (inositol monophosphatase family)
MGGWLLAIGFSLLANCQSLKANSLPTRASLETGWRGTRDTMNLEYFLDVAMEAAYTGGKRTLAYYNAGVAVETKSDDTPVTIADRESEAAIRAVIRARFPSHSILGEEEGESDGDPDYRWIIDPLDGTKSFVRGVPLYGSLVGLEIGGVAQVGAVYMPVLNEMLSAATGLGCRWNGRPARVSGIDRLEDATLLTTSSESVRKRGGVWDKLSSRTKLTRGWGDCYGYTLVATGRAEIMLDAGMNPWDCAPLLPILTEAGGRFTDWNGTPTIHGKDGFGTNGLLHDAVLEILRAG